MKEYWVWRAVGGTLMFFSHIIFAYNFYYMVKNRDKNYSAAEIEERPVYTTETKEINT
jgi:cytochrome c oxidase cbb3-type subunit 1